VGKKRNKVTGGKKLRDSKIRLQKGSSKTQNLDAKGSQVPWVSIGKGNPTLGKKLLDRFHPEGKKSVFSRGVPILEDLDLAGAKGVGIIFKGWWQRNRFRGILRTTIIGGETGREAVTKVRKGKAGSLPSWGF